MALDMDRDEDPYTVRRSRRDVEEWEDDEDDDRPRRGLFSTLFGLVKLGLFLTPLTLFGYGYFFADCRPGAGSGMGQWLTASVCARNEVVSSAFSMQDNLRLIRRLID